MLRTGRCINNKLKIRPSDDIQSCFWQFNNMLEELLGPYKSKCPVLLPMHFEMNTADESQNKPENVQQAAS